MNPALQVSDLNHWYGQHQALNSINLQVSSGKIVGLLGPNGAGKTTLISILSGLFAPSSGRIEILGATNKTEIKNIRHQLGVATQEISLFELLTPLENLQYFGTLLGLKNSEIRENGQDLLQQFGLWEVRNKAIKKFSGGMKRRLNLIASLLHNPKILFLDEPTEGIDVQSRNAILEYLKKLNQKQNTTIIYTSHLLAEAEDLCQEVIIIDKGKKLLEGSMDKLKGRENNSLQDVFLELTGTHYRDLS